MLNLDAAIVVTHIILFSSDLFILDTKNCGAATWLVADVFSRLYRVIRLHMNSDSLYCASEAEQSSMQGFCSRVNWALKAAT